METICSSRPPP